MNNKGFAISTIVYGVLLMSSIVLILLIATMSSNKDQNDTIYEDIDEQLSIQALEKQQPKCPVNVRYIVLEGRTSASVDAYVEGNNTPLVKQVIASDNPNEVIVDLGREYQVTYLRVYASYTKVKTYDETRIKETVYHDQSTDEIYLVTFPDGYKMYTPDITC